MEFLTQIVLSIIISFFRYYAILKPLNVKWEARARRALHIAWMCAGLASLPQSFIFHLEEHPEVKGYVTALTLDNNSIIFNFKYSKSNNIFLAIMVFPKALVF